MSAETLLTAARRVVRYARADDAKHGGLLSLDTIQAVEMLDLQIARATALAKASDERFTSLHGAIEDGGAR